MSLSEWILVILVVAYVAYLRADYLQFKREADHQDAIAKAKKLAREPDGSGPTSAGCSNKRLEQMKHLPLAALALAVMTAPAGAQEDTSSANYMLPHCKSVLSDTPRKGTFTGGVCAGSITAFGFVSRSLDGEFRFCFPEGVINDQMFRVVVSYIEARPSRMHEDWRVLALEALREAWPCNSTKLPRPQR
jgi:hypothetical protein